MFQNRKVTLLSAVAMSALSNAALAQEVLPAATVAAPDTTKATNDPSTGDIVVTARRRSESLQRTPVAIAVLSGDALTKQAVVSEADLQIASPGLTVRAGLNSNQLNYAIRGQSLDAFSNSRPGVVAYTNEVQIGGDGGSTAFYDLQSIQILKGPQGTLFGRNATGGAVLFTTAKPRKDLGGYISTRVGNYNLLQTEGALNIPLAEGKILARVAGFYESRDGFQYDLFKKQRAGDVDRFGLRGSLTLELSSSLRNEIVLDYLHSNGSNQVSVIASLNPSGAVPVTALTAFGNQATFNYLINAFTGGQAGCNSTTNNCAATYAAANPQLDPGGIASYINTQKQRGPYQVATDGANHYRGRNTIITNLTTLDIGNGTQIKNIFGYTDLDTSIFADVDGSPYGIDDNGVTGKLDHTRQISNELQLVGKAVGGNLSYVAGIFVSHEIKTQHIGTYLFTGLPIFNVQIAAGRTRNTTLAGYAQGTYDLEAATGITGLSVTGGIRYTNEKVKYNVLSDDQYRITPAPEYVFDQAKSYSNVSWTLGVQDQINPNLLVYVVSRRSYRNGGYNVIAAPIEGLGSINGGNGFGLETVTDAELGIKLRHTIGIIPVQLSFAAYKNWISDNQRVAYTLLRGAPAAVTVGVPKATVQGFEVDGNIGLTKWLSLGGSLNFTDARFTDNRTRIAGGDVVEFGTYPDTPKWSGSIFGEVTVPINNGLKTTFRSDIYAQSKFFYTSTGNANPGAQIAGYELVNLRLALEDSISGWTLAANLKNALKKTYFVGGIATGELFQLNTAVPGSPQTFMIEARLKF